VFEGEEAHQFREILENLAVNGSDPGPLRQREPRDASAWHGGPSCRRGGIVDALDHLDAARRHHEAGEVATAMEALVQYWAWRRQSGAEPFCEADVVADRLERRLRQQLRAQRNGLQQGPVPLAVVLDELATERAWKWPRQRQDEDEDDSGR
jgi:hypothetical protein